MKWRPMSRKKQGSMIQRETYFTSLGILGHSPQPEVQSFVSTYSTLAIIVTNGLRSEQPGSAPPYSPPEPGLRDNICPRTAIHHMGREEWVGERPGPVLIPEGVQDRRRQERPRQEGPEDVRVAETLRGSGWAQGGGPHWACQEHSSAY